MRPTTFVLLPRVPVLALVTLLVIGSLPAGSSAAPAQSSTAAALTVTFCDVGQNDASVVQAGDAAVMIDTGHWRHTNALDCLDELGVDRLDLLVVTHAHSDHVGQARQVLDHVQVDEVWRVDFDPSEDAAHRDDGDPRRLVRDLFDPRWRYAERDLEAYREFDAEARRRTEAGELRLVDPLSSHIAGFGPLEVLVLHPDELAPGDEGYDDIHDRGNIALRIEADVQGHGDASVLFTGDAEAQAERRMVAGHADQLAADVYQMGHHGSATSTTQELVDAGGFELAVWSAATDSPYGHPHREPVRRLVEAGVTVYGTGEHGTVTARADASGWSVATEIDAPPTQPPAPGLLEGLIGGVLGRFASPSWG